MNAKLNNTPQAPDINRYSVKWTPWTLCLLVSSFVPIPRTLVTCDASAVVVKCPALPGKLKLGPNTLAGVGRARKTEKNLSVRVMDRLQQAEAHESHAHRRQDYRQAWICVSFAHKGRPEPFLESSYAVYGCAPEFVFPRWLEEQRAKLGAEFYLFYDDRGILRPDVPPIPSTSAALLPNALAANGADLSTDLGLGTVGPVTTNSDRRTV